MFTNLIKFSILASFLCGSFSIVSGTETAVDGHHYNESLAKLAAEYSSIVYCKENTIKSWSNKHILTTKPLKNLNIVTSNFLGGMQSFVGYDEKENSIIVSFRGTSNVQNGIQDITALQIAPYDEIPQVLVHKGFYQAYLSVKRDIWPSITSLQSVYSNAKLLITGHSEGAALSSLCAFDMAYLGNQKNIIVYNFGQPRVGNKAFADLYKNLIPTYYRITHWRDVVPQVPATSGLIQLHYINLMGNDVKVQVPFTSGIEYQHLANEVHYSEAQEAFQVCSSVNGEDSNPYCESAYNMNDCFSILDHLTYLNTSMNFLTC